MPSFCDSYAVPFTNTEHRVGRSREGPGVVRKVLVVQLVRMLRARCSQGASPFLRFNPWGSRRLRRTREGGSQKRQVTAGLRTLRSMQGLVGGCTLEQRRVWWGPRISVKKTL